MIDDFRDVLRELIAQLGLPPYRIAILTSVSGAAFDYAGTVVRKAEKPRRFRKRLR